MKEITIQLILSVEPSLTASLTSKLARMSGSLTSFDNNNKYSLVITSHIPSDPSIQNLSFSDGEEKSKSRNQSEEKNIKKQTLPQLRSRQQIESQTSGGILSSNNNIENKKEENLDKLVKGIVTHKEPKVVKIYKKLKGSNEMTITKKEFQDKDA